MKKTFLILLSALCSLPSPPASAQYAPQAGIVGSDAVSATSLQIVNWANSCTIHRGWLDIAQPSLGIVTSGDSSLAVGVADNFVVSLGDSGVAVLAFPHSITDLPGADFVIFENGFLNANNNEEAFLELAFVEVSSDGVNFFRFPASSLAQDSVQISSTGGLSYLNARELNNLAGKYIGNYGTPFDLQDLSGTSGLNLNRITHVRIVDVVGAIDKHVQRDAANRIINDPYPTDFPTGGFDLDAVGVIHENMASVVQETGRARIQVYPNPTTNFITIETYEAVKFFLSDISGKVLQNGNISGEEKLFLRDYNAGIYLLKFVTKEGTAWVQRITKI